ncbi:MAG: 2-dehydropantoate 2-reductase [Candidatus Electrothrix scaldis]|nr:MAG: 2-dehydropantoate 2-reductase [Candidatus Electrothrix sp. GW3-3]
MKITIIGAGAMGCLFGGILSEQGQDVCLLDIREEQIKALNKQGLIIRSQNEERKIKVHAVSNPSLISKTDLAIIFVKHAQTEVAAQTAARLLNDKGYVLTLQNGMGNAEIIAKVVGKDQVLCGTTAQGAMILGLGKIQHSGQGETIIGAWQPHKNVTPSLATQVADIFTRAGISCQAVGNIEPVLWKKLCVNVGINAITALTGLRNGQLLDQEATRLLMRDLVAEAISVAQAHSVTIPSGIMEHVEQVAQATASNRSSMGQDVDEQRLTEIDAINGYVLRKAKEAGIAAPINQTIVRLIQTLQAHYSNL